MTVFQKGGVMDPDADKQQAEQEGKRKDVLLATAVGRISRILEEIENLQTDIKIIAENAAEVTDIKAAKITALAKEKVSQTSTKAIEKHQEIIDVLSTLPKVEQTQGT